MPKYSLQDVLDIIQTLTPDEKSQLQDRLPHIISATITDATPQRSQSQSFGNINMGKGNTFTANQAGEEVNSSQSNIQASVQNDSLQQALDILQKLREDVSQSDVLNKLQKTTINGTIKVVEEEISKPQPDKSLLDQAIEALKKGVEIISLAEPVMKVAGLVAGAWGV
jgi:folylpolyglutamate synthase/dihydropteroate synthase